MMAAHLLSEVLRLSPVQVCRSQTWDFQLEYQSACVDLRVAESQHCHFYENYDAMLIA